jgi:hypothetical protein
MRGRGRRWYFKEHGNSKRRSALEERETNILASYTRDAAESGE